MRYLGRFPSEAQIQLIMVQLVEDSSSETLQYERVEQYLLDVLQTNDFMPGSYENMMACFKRFDPKDTGMIKIEKFKIMVKECE